MFVNSQQNGIVRWLCVWKIYNISSMEEEEEEEEEGKESPCMWGRKLFIDRNSYSLFGLLITLLFVGGHTWM